MEVFANKNYRQLESDEKFHLLVEIYLFEEEAQSAITTLEKVNRHWHLEELRFKVARLAKADFAHDALRILKEDVEMFIARRGRDNYAQAAQWLQEVQGIYRQMGNILDWEQFIGVLREKNKRLPALQDELNKRKL